MTEPSLELSDPPYPAIESLPDWYKKMSPYIGGEKDFSGGGPNLTVKKCVPVLDSLSAGYIIPLWTDVAIYRQREGITFTPSNTRAGIKAVEGHPKEQIPGYPVPHGYESSVHKWINPWRIKTKKGYSCMFINPTHRELPFRILEGVVDTDTFPLSINFPFFLEEGFEGVIPCGTPIAQVIPFKRETYKSDVVSLDSEKYFKLHNFHDNIFMNRYKLKWWSRKIYK